MSLKPEFEAAVRNALSQIMNLEVGPIEADRPISDLGLDSVSMLEMVEILEQTLNTTIDERRLTELRTLQDLQRLLEPTEPQG